MTQRLNKTTANKQINTRRKNSLDLGTMVYGKVPPQAKDLEEAILGALLLERDAFDKLAGLMHPEIFYVEAHQRIFSAMQRLVNKSQPIDSYTVAEELRSTEELEIVGGPYYVTKLTNSVVSSANIEAHCKIVTQKFIQRELIRVGGIFIEDGYSDTGDVFDMIDNAEQALFKVMSSIRSQNYFTMDQLLVTAVKEIETARHSEEKLSGVTSGFVSMDKLTHGWQPTDLIILAARPAVGKTAFALNLARNAAKAGTPVGFFSLEMSAGQLIRRLMSAESEMPLEKIQRARMEDNDMKILYSKGIQPLSQAPIMIDDTAGMNIFELRSKARQMKNKQNVGLIIVDYLQLMSGISEGRQQNREQEISNISRNLKQLAKELNIPIIALSQLSRETEKRTSKEPQLSDLRESGAIEQDADAVIFIYRPEYYGIQRDAAGESNPGETHFKFAKYRNGSPGMVKLRAQLWIQKFVEMEDLPFVPKGKELKKDERGVTQLWQPFNESKEQVDPNDKTFNTDSNS
jgi:replicative DNA helicase